MSFRIQPSDRWPPLVPMATPRMVKPSAAPTTGCFVGTPNHERGGGTALDPHVRKD